MLYINEIVPNPKGTDSGNEWLELLNDAPHAASLEGWRLTVNGKAVALHGQVGAQSYAVLRGKQVKRALTNRELKLGLYNPAGQLEHALIMYGTAQEGKSFSRYGDDVFHWTEPTPGEQNSEARLGIVAPVTQPFDTNLADKGSFTGSLGSGILLALIFTVFVTVILKKSHALPQYFSRPYAPHRGPRSGAR